MRRLLTSDNGLELDNHVAALRGVQPVINGQLLMTTLIETVEESPDRVELRFSAPALRNGCFGLELVEEKARDRFWMRYWLVDVPDDLVLDSFGLRIAAVENVRAYLRQGYTSWDGSFYVQPDAMADVSEDRSRYETGYAMTQIVPRRGHGCLVIGFDRHDRFQQTFTFDTRQQPTALTILTWWDRKDRAGLSRCESERLVLFTHGQVEAGLRDWACIVASSSPMPARVPGDAITGWCSWYNLYAAITEENILEHLEATSAAVRREQLPMRVFQIDDGFTPEMGDWLEVKPQFPRGMKPLLDEIRSAGFVPGLWIAPFMVGNRSRLYRTHPDWVVQDQESGGPLVQMRFYGEFRWHKRSEEYYILDATNPDAFAYLRLVFRTWRREWGCGYFKTDFMHFGSDHGPDRAGWHEPGMTRIEIWRRTAEMIREEIGDALWLGCGCPLWASVGLVDGVRIGRDVGVAWGKGLATQSIVRDQATRNFANHILWQSDPDCVLLRQRFHYLSEAEMRSLALYAGMSGGVLMTSDRLDELPPERLRLWRTLLNWASRGCDFPLLGETEIIYEAVPGGDEPRYEPRAVDPVLVQVRQPPTSGGIGAIFILNAGTETVQRRFDLGRLGVQEPAYVVDWMVKEIPLNKVSQIDITLPGHEGVLYLFSRVPLDLTAAS